MDRRKFLGVIAGSAAGMGGLGASCDPRDGHRTTAALEEQPPSEPASGRPRVVVLERSDLPKGKDLDQAGADILIRDTLSALKTGRTALQALKALFRPDERVGIKLNCLGGRGLSPSPPLVRAFTDLLVEAGLTRSRIVLFERTERELARAGFSPDPKGAPRVMAHDSPGCGYESEPELHGSIGSCFARILTRKIDALVSFGVVKDHDLAGVSLGLKNLYGLIHNPNKYHDGNCSPYVADVAGAPPVRGKLRLVICDGLTAQYKGGPASSPRYQWRAGLVLASTDPVALDAVGASLLDAKRTETGVPLLADSGQRPAYLEVARKHGLGEDRLDRVEIKRI